MNDNSTSIEKEIISVEEAEKIVLSQLRDFGIEKLSFTDCLGRVLAQDMVADRDLPPFDRVTMDGIAIKHEAIEKGITTFSVTATQAAGQAPIEIQTIHECIEIMTGAALPSTTDTVIRYEDIEIKNGEAVLLTGDIKPRQNIHRKGNDKRENEVLVKANSIITPSIISVAASVGAKTISVKRLPEVVVISTGNEVVDVGEKPSLYQIRNSNAYSIQAVLNQHGIQPSLLHLNDDENTIREKLGECLNKFDVLILSGGVSMGKFDYLPKVLEELSVKKLFYKVQQRPGKPFWFGSYERKLIFAFPGNPVSTFLCLHRYLLPWIKNCLSIPPYNMYGVLNEDIEFRPALAYFPQVKLRMNEEGTLLAEPIKGNGSGDFSALIEADAFLELPFDKTVFRKGEVFKLWMINKISK